MLETDELNNFEQIRKHTRTQLEKAARSDEPALVVAPPNSGKTLNALKLARDPELPPITYYTERTDLYREAKDWASNYDDLRAIVIPSPYRDCPTFDGDSPEARNIRRLYNKGKSAYELHMNPRDEAYTPCMSPECGYIKKLHDVDDEIGDIDLLIGNHLHARREKYNKDRVVIIDEFNADPFLTSFPSRNSDIIDEPGKIIPDFLSTAGEYGFPAEKYGDVTGIIEQRDNTKALPEVFEWFKTHGASRAKVEELEFISTTARPYDQTHIQAPLLALSLFCMEDVGSGYELAPGLSGKYDEIWRNAGLHLNIKCVRNRNTGQMHLLRPPDLSSAAQVIGLDGTPTELLWNLLFCNNTHFETYRVIRREDYPAFLNSAMNMDLVQLGNGAHHYGGGEPSPYDKHRFATVQLRENERFALVTSKNALEHYHTSRLLADYVHRDQNPDEDSNRRYPRFKARHYGTIRSSNDLAEEPIGVVAGTPHPGDEVIQLWSAFCGTVGEPKGEGPERQYGKGQTEKIYNHFVHNQIAQAVLRFGRDGQVINSGGSTVYVITKALPRWLEVEHSIDIRKNEAEISIISTIISQDEGEAQLKYDPFTVSNISEEVELSWKKVRKTLEMLVDEKVLTVSRDHAKGGADLYYWAGPERIRYDKKADRHLMLGNNNLFVLPNL